GRRLPLLRDPRGERAGRRGPRGAAHLGLPRHQPGRPGPRAGDPPPPRHQRRIDRRRRRRGGGRDVRHRTPGGRAGGCGGQRIPAGVQRGRGRPQLGAPPPPARARRPPPRLATRL
ncbi:MAG: Bis(5'-nucleosyl)-tetraphosphatase (asymmetrical), partial [uncultured Acidimicrobiales bacterium]